MINKNLITMYNNKVAKLVTFSLMTRIVVDEDTDEETIATRAIGKIKDNLEDYLNITNLDEITDDTECPYGTCDGELPAGPAILLFDIDYFARPDIENMDNDEAFMLALKAERDIIGYCLTPLEYQQMLNDQEIETEHYWIKFVTIK